MPIDDDESSSDESSELGIVRASLVRPRSIEWLSKPLLQASAFTLLAGPKGAGKGTWLARVIGKMTRGEYGGKTHAILVTSEDSHEIDVVPRLIAAHANLDNVHLVTRDFRLPRDLDVLRDEAVKIGNVGLIAIDPLGNHLGGADTDKEGSVRNAVSGLNRLADELGCVVLGVRHVGKSRERGGLAAILGSTAWVDLPRCVLIVARDDSDERVFHVHVAAGNRSEHGAGNQYRIELREVAGLREPVTYALELGASDKDSDELLAAPKRSSKSNEAGERILAILRAEGEQESDALDARIVSEFGLSTFTVRDVRKALRKDGHVKAIPVRDESGAVAAWHVALGDNA